MLNQKQLSLIRNYFRTKPAVVAVYLYGSQARGTDNPLSDLDFAIMLEQLEEHSTALRLEIIGQLMKLLQTDQLDIQLLAPQTAPALALNMLKGKLLFCRSYAKKNAVAAQILSRYQDFQPFLSLQLKTMRERLEKGSYAH